MVAFPVGDGTTFTAAGFNLTVTGTTTVGAGVSGGLTISSSAGTKTFIGPVTINTGGTWNNSGNSAVTFRGGITNNGTFTAGTGVHTFDTNAQALSGNAFTIPSVTITTITLTNNNSLTVNTALSGTGTLLQAAGATLNIGAASTLSNMNATASGNTVNYTAATGGQTLIGGTYFNVSLNNTSGTNTANGNVSVTGAMVTNGGAGGTLNMSTFTLAGTSITNNGTINTQNTSATPIPSGQSWGGTINYNATTGNQTVVIGTYTNLTSGNTSGINSAAGNLVIDGILTTTASGTLSLGTNTISGTLTTINNNGTISTANTTATPLPTGLTWGGTINYNALTGGQTIVTGTYNNLTLGNTSGTSTPASDLVVNGILTTTAGGTLDMTTFALTGTLSSVVNNGTFSTANTSATPMPSGKTWAGTFIYAGAASQTVVTGIYSNLNISNTTGVALGGAVTVNTSLSVSSSLTLGTNNLTLGFTSAVTGASSSVYIVTNSTGQLRRTVVGSPISFPVGNSAYNPIILSNSGTSDVYGINVIDGAVTTAIDQSLTVDRRWQITEAVAGGSNLAVTAQYNSGETSADFSTGNPIIGLYNGTAWVKNSATYSGGSSPFTFTSLGNFTPASLTTGTQYLALGKDFAFVASPGQFAVTSIVPNPAISGSGFQVTIEAQNASNQASNVTTQTFFNLSTNGNAGALSGTTSGSIPAGQSSVTVSGVILSSLGTGATITATLDNTNGGDALTPGTSAPFNVVASATSDIITAGNETPNIDYNSKTGAVINTTSDAIRVWSFSVRDGGSTPDADNLATILSSVTISKGAGNTVASWANSIQEAALFDESTKVAEITVSGESLVFTSLNGGAGVTADDNSSKTLDLYLTFKTANTDGQRLQFAITSAGASATAAGSLFNSFATTNSSVTGTNNRIQVIASKLIFGAQALTDVAVGVAMTPAFTIRGVDVNNNLDIDYTSTITLAVTGSTFNGAAPSAAAIAGIATFSPVFATTGTGVTITGSDGVITATPPSNTFNVTNIVPATTDLFRSKTTGDWDQVSTWQESHDGTSWFDAAVTPTSANSSSILIQNTHVVTVVTSVTIDQTTVNTGGAITVNSGQRLDVADGTGTDLTINGNVTVNGFLRLANNATMTSTAASLTFNSGGTYEHNYTTAAGTIPTATWSTGSTCSIIGYTTNTTVPGGLGQSFWNFTWNCTSQGAGTLNLNSQLTTIQGDFSLLSTGTTGIVALMNNTTFTITIGGNLIVGSGTNQASLDWFTTTTGNGTPTMNLAGNISIGSAGSIVRSGSNNTPILNFNKASGIQTYSSANAAGISGGRFAATVGTGTSTNTLQLLSDMAMNGNGAASLQVAANATLDCGTRIVTSVGGTFNLNAGGSIITAHAQGLSTTASTGSIQVTGTKTFNAAANYTYNATGAQVTGNALTTANNLTINNPAGVTLTANTTVNGTLTLTNGLLTLGTNSLTIGAAGSISGGSSTAYVNTNNSGFLRRTVAASPVAFPVGTTAYNPITLTNTGTSDVYSIIETDGTVPNALDATFTVNRRWRVTEAVSGGSNLSVVGQYNSGEAAANFNSGIIPKIGFYNGTVWTENAATQAGAGPFTFTSNANFTPTNLTTGTQYFALGKDQAFTPIPQGTLTANSICEVGTGQLTFTATAGTSPFTVVYNDGTGNVTQNNVISGTPFNVTPNPTVTTSYTLVSVTDNDGDVRSSGFTGGTATITVNPAIANNTIAADQTICSGTTPAAMTGSAPTGGNGTYIFQWQSSTTSATTGFANAAGTSTGQNYTPPGNITQTTWYRRVVTSNGCTDNGTAIQVTITPAPTITPGPTLTATQSCAPVAITLTGASFTAPATSAAWSIVSGGGTLSTTALTASPATVTYTPASNFSGAVTLALTTDACPTLSANRTINVSLPTIVNYDFNTGNSFATLVSNAVPNITATASGSSFATSTTSTVTGGNAFTVNSTAGNSLSQAAVANNNWTFTLTGNDVRFYKTFRVYFLGQRNSGTTGQNINILYSVDGGAFVSLGNLGLNNLGTWVESLLSLPVAADNPTTSIAIRLNINAGNGTTLIDNFQMQAIYTQPADKTPVVAASLVCEGTGTNIQIPASQVGVNYQLRNNTGNVNIGSAVAGTGSTINLPTGNLTTATTFNVLASNSCSVQMANTVTVNVTPLATLSSSLTTPDICTNTAFSYTPTSTTSGATFNWSRAAVAGISNSPATGTGDPNETLINTTATPKSVTYAYTVTANGCTNPTAFNVVVVVNPSPTLSSTLTPQAVCDGNPFQYIPTSATPGATFNWSRAAVAGISNAPESGTDDPNETLFNLTPDPINVTYVYSLSANGCVNPTTYNVVVTIEPSPTAVATDTVVSNTAGVCGASITLGNNVTTNGTLSFSIDGNPITMPHTFPIGTTNVTVTAENNCGTSTTFFDVTVNDTEAPVVPTLSDVTGECSATATAPVATDNCEGPITGTTTDPLTYSTQGTFVIHWSFDDGNGNVSTATQNVIVQDVTAPAIPTLNDVTGECSATATAPVATDNCVGPITGTTTDPLTYTTQGSFVIHWSFDDGRGNISTATQNVVVEDVTPPAIPTLNDVTGECTATATAPTTTDNCSGTITGTTTDALTYSTQGTHVIHWSFDDGNGNISTANQNVVIEDVTPPAVPVLTNLTDECSVTATAPTTTDNCSGTITGTTTDPLTYTTQGTHTIHWSFDDGNGNISTANQNVVIEDVTPPAVPTLANVTGECSATATAPTTTDNCAGTITGTTTDPLTYTTQGTHVIHWSFDDGNGNTSTANQNVVIEDVTPPAVPTLANVTGECSATATAPTTTDNCSGTITGTTTDPLTYTTQGTHVIHWSFDDGNGNISNANQNVVINDVTPPAVPTLANVTGECSATATSPTTTDNCTGTITGTTTDPLTYTTQGTHVIHWSFDDGNGNISTANQNVIVDDITPPAVPVLSNITGECSATATAPTTTDNCAGTITGTTTDPLTYTSGTHIIHWSFNDGNGNISTADQNVIINDVTPPATPVLNNITAECSVTVTAPTTTDNCAGTITGTTTDPLTYSTQGTHTIHWSFDDGSGNIATANQSVIITDNTPPAIPVLANVTGECSATATAPTTTDNCAGTVTGTTTDPLTYTTQGTHVIHWSFDDGSGNISTANQNVVISDVTPPAAPVLANVTGECSATATAPTTTDNCSGTITGTTTDPLTYTSGTHVIHWSFDDGHGNTSTANQNVIIQDVTGPTVNTAANSLNATLECDNTSGVDAALLLAPSATDNCGGTPVIHLLTDVTTQDPLCPNGYTRVRTWNFTDANNNPSANFVQTIIVRDQTPPFVVQMPADVIVDADVNCQATGVNLGILSAQDNCSPTVTITNDHPSIYPIGNTIVTWTIKDDCNNTITRQQTVRVQDHTNPVIANCPADITVFTGPGALTCVKAVSWTAPSASDNCSVINSFTSNYNPGAVFPVGTTLVTYVATDASTNSSTCSFNVTVVDNTPPVINNCPANIVTCNPNVTWTAPTATDNCSVTTFNSDAPASFLPGVTTVTYTAKDAAGNTTTCSFTVTLNPTPNAVAASNSPICSGNTLNLSAAGGTTYAWTGPNSFSSSQQNPSINLATTAATGTYTVVVSNNFGCTATATTNVVVSAGATATAGSNSPVCTGGTLNLSASGGVSYSWTGPNGFVSLQQNPTIVNVTNNASGIYTVTVTNAAGCTAQAFTSVSVGVANAFAANNGPLCEGTTLSLSAAGGTSYAWTGPNSFSSTQQNPAIPNTTTAASGSYTVTVTGSGGCTATATTNVTVNAVPTPLAANNGPVCQGGTLSLSAAGGTSYSWTGPNGFSSLQQNPVIFNIPSAGAGFYTVTVTNAAGCSSTATTQVTVNTGALASAASNSPVCTGSTLTLFASAGASYSWTGPNGFSSIQQNPTLTGVTNAASGIYTVTVNYASGCSSTASTSVAVNQQPIASASANGPVCEGATLNFSASGGTAYSWTGPNSFSSTQQNPSISGVTSAATGTYTVTVSNAANCTAQTTVFVQVNAAPVASASSNSPVCAGATLNLFGSGGTSYSWTGPNGFSSTQQNPAILNATAAAGGTYTLSVTNAAGCTSTTTTNVTVNTGVIASASSNTPVCTGTTLNLFAGGGVSYSWNGPNGFNSTQQNPTVANVTAAAAGTYTVIVTASGGCTASTTTSVAVNTGSVGGSVSGSTSVCSGSNSGTLNLTGHTGNVMRWEMSTDGGGSWSTISNTTTSLTYSNLTQTTQYQAVVQNATCTSATSAIATITVNNGAVGGTVSGSMAVCNGSNSGSVNLSGQSGTITKWQFSTDGGGSWTDIANTTASQAYNNLTQTTMYHAVITGCTTVNSGNATITVTNGSVGGSVSGTTSVCSGSNSGTMNLSGHTGNVVRWEMSTDGGGSWSTISNTTTSQSYSNLTQTTQYRAVVQSGTCTPANSAAATITISATATGGNVSGSTTVCTGTNSGTVTLSGQAGTITKWQFSTDGGGSWTDIVNTTTSQSYNNLTQSTQYRAVITGCTTVNSGAATITVTPASAGGTVSGSSTVCSGSNSGTMVLSGHTGNVIRWEFSTDGGGTWSTINNTTTSQTYTNLTATRQYRAVVLSGVCASANSAAAIITVGGSAVGGTVSGSATVCSGSNNGTLTLSGHSGTVSMWQFSTNGGGSWTNIANTTTSQTYTNLTQTTQYRAVISGCATTVNSGIATVTVGASLAVTIAASDAANEFCNNLTLTANASVPVQSYLWSNSATTQSIKLGGANAAGNYTVTVTAVGGCTGTATYNYNPQAVTSNYTILGLQTVNLFANNTVQNGSVGANASNGTITIGNTTSVAASGAFVKAQTLTISASANVPVRINAPAGASIPMMQFNTTNTNALGNVSIANNTNGTVNGNFRNLTIGTNCNVTLTGTIFRLIAVGAGSTIRFTQPVINIGGINLTQGTASSPTTVAFSQATVVKSNADINVAPLCTINPDNYKVVFYIGVSSGNSSPDFNVTAGGNVTVNASIYVPNGDISVGGSTTNNSFMNGKFIASLVRSTGQRVIWNSFDCGTANLITRTSVPNVSSATIIPIIEPDVAYFTATVTPVPTENFFTLKIKSNSDETIQVKIFDIVGRQIEQLHGSPAQSYRFGNGYMQGSYIVEIHQGNKVKVMQVVKL
ncbi:HYR domain-containing protein [Niastella sp. OAS944]|uniref:HYR domain-containing protein n=1 Tax=Niastella sp. OAS944 TaxID=2664089 RepID=UPI00346E2D3B